MRYVTHPSLFQPWTAARVCQCAIRSRVAFQKPFMERIKMSKLARFLIPAAIALSLAACNKPAETSDQPAPPAASTAAPAMAPAPAATAPAMTPAPATTAPAPASTAGQ
jgi:hypothetical protein